MLLEGQQCSHYRLTHLLKQGGMGQIYQAEDISLQRQVAIKVIRTDFTHTSNQAAIQEASHLFLREAIAIAQLDHSHILPLYDSGNELIDGIKVMYMVMPLRHEGSFADWLQVHTEKGRLPLAGVERVVRQAAEALQHAHDRQIIHKDVKPSNFLVREHAEHLSQLNLQLADFGVAKVMRLTSESQVIRGTPPYMAPEMWEGQPVPATDQYALAMMAYELLTGRHPFHGRGHQQVQLWYQHMHTRPAAPSTLNPALPHEVDEVILRALAKNPRDRFVSISIFAHAFQRAVLNSGNIHQTSTVSALEAQRGANRFITLPDGRKVPVPVPVPAGAYPGQIIRIESYGYPTTYDGPKGVLILTVALFPSQEKMRNTSSSQKNNVPASPTEMQVEESLFPSKLMSKESGEFFRGVQQVRLLIRNCGKHFQSWIMRAIKPSNAIRMPQSEVPGAPPTILFPESLVSRDPPKDFFVSYSKDDFSLAMWIKAQLDEAEYSTIVPPWGIRSDSDIKIEMQKSAAKARCMIVILSPNYFNTLSNRHEWIENFKRVAADEPKTLLLIHVQECGQEIRKLLDATNYIDIAGKNGILSRALLLAAAGNESVELTIPAVFPENRLSVLPEKPSFQEKLPVENEKGSVGTITTWTDPMIKNSFIIRQVESAFLKKDWPDVIRKVDYLIKMFPDATSSEVYRMQGKAFLIREDKQRACEALHTALSLVSSNDQRLVLLKEYTDILFSLNRWNDVLQYAEEALQLAPNDFSWLVIQKQTLMQLNGKKNAFIDTQSHISISQISAETRLEVFLSYSHNDEGLRQELEKYLSTLRRLYSITAWHDGEIGPGNEWGQEIDKHLSQAHIILLLISQDFIASNYCYDIEMKRALERHNKGEACVIPIILRPAHWKVTPFRKLQALPAGGKPVTTWSNRDEALLNITEGIQRTIDRLTTDSTAK